LENEFYWKGFKKSNEPETTWLWSNLCKNATTIIDIGANTGTYALIASAINPNGKIIAFEPSAKTFARLKDNVELNNLKNHYRRRGRFQYKWEINISRL